MNIVRKRLAYRIGDLLPKPLKILYYLVLWLTLIYIFYRLIVFFLKTIQKVGYFIFDPKNYWTVILCITVLLLGSLLIGQFWLGLDPIGKFINRMLEWGEGILETVGL